ncbi:MAG: hypothetical protein CR217_03985 [Beijerinckiaceae bacterium]|nr:MAG: hypothetical protein CR217_03985 [Beijerinckiaceae bacterium]
MTAKPKTHRRAFLRSMATLPIVASPIATAAYAATGGQDAELIALGEQLSAAWATENALRLEGADSHEADEITDAAVAVASDIVDEIHGLRATTLAGAKVKAQAIWWCCSGEEIEDDHFSYGEPATDKRLVAGLLRDLLDI